MAGLSEEQLKKIYPNVKKEKCSLYTKAFNELDNLLVIQRMNDRLVQSNVPKMPWTFPETFLTSLAYNTIINSSKTRVVNSIIGSFICIT